MGYRGCRKIHNSTITMAKCRALQEWKELTWLCVDAARRSHSGSSS